MMKKMYFLLIAFLMSVSGAFAQKPFTPEFAVGISGGALYSSVDFVPAVLQQNKLGAMGGVTARYISEKNFGGLQLELNLAQRGWSEEFENNPDFAYTRTLNYVEMPLLWHIYFGNKLRYVINVGSQISYLLSSTDAMSEALAADLKARRDAAPTAKIGMQYHDVWNKFDYGLIGGTGLEFKSGIGSFVFEVRYYFGFGDIFENGRSATSFFARSAHRILGAKLSYLYHF